MTGPRLLLSTVVGGLALAAAFPSLDFWPLAWVALVPWLLAVRGRGIGAAYGWGFVFGFVFNLAVLYWIPATISNYTVINEAAAVGLLVLLAAAVSGLVSFAPCAAVGEWLAGAGISRVVAYPVVWVVLEWSRNFVIAGFPWASLGYSQYRFLAVAQLAELGSVYAISALLIFVNASLAEFLIGGVSKHRRLAVAVAGAVLITVAFGGIRLATLPGADDAATLKVGLLQGNIAQSEKWDPANQDSTIDTYLELSSRAVESGARMVVWPEAAVPFLLARDPRRQRLADFAVENDVPLLVGSPGYDSRDGGPPKAYNQAWMVTPSGALAGPYDKIQLVPFGEYIPLFGLFGMVDVAVQSVGQFGRGLEYDVFEGPQVAGNGGGPARFSVLICYEGIFPALTRSFVTAGADFLVNISNDAWYGGTSAPYQHISMVALRAIENRVPIVRSTSTGITGVIGIDGRIRGATDLFVQDVVVDSINLGGVRGIYTLIGDLFVYVCLAALAGLIAVRIRLRGLLIR